MTNDNPNGNGYIASRIAADLLKVSRTRIRNMARASRIPGNRYAPALGRKLDPANPISEWVFTQAEIDRVAVKLLQDPTSALAKAAKAAKAAASEAADA